ncbi:MAG: arginase family protein, partial [Pseudomonadota bacterium]|nr:arginase family protein [Pseudomonadota bacterium]
MSEDNIFPTVEPHALYALYQNPNLYAGPLCREPSGTDIAMVGAPFDSAITNRPGARHGPRGLRDQSSLIRRVHRVTHANPVELYKIADVGDTPVNPVNVAKCLDLITEFYRPIAEAGVTPLSVDGDHLIYLPVFRANATDSSVGMVHFDTHTYTADEVYNGG